jgi:long-chain fatty acid transport protein
MRKLILLAFALLPSLLFAQGFQVNLEGQKQIGMGETGTGLPQDGAAVFFNPGAVVMLQQNYIQAGVSPLLFESVFNPSGTNAQFHTATKIVPPFTFYAAVGPKSAWWKLGFAVYTPFGGLANWGDNWTGKYSLESLNLRSYYFQPTLSIKLAKNLSIGAGFVYDRGTVDLTQAIPLSNQSGQDGQAELNGAGHGYGWNSGIYYKPSEKLSIGITYRSKVNTTINNGSVVFTVPGSLQSLFPQPNTFTSSIPLPSTTSLGLGFFPTKKLTLAFDFNYVGWSVYKQLDFIYAHTTADLQNTYSQRDYKNAYTLRAGGQYQLTSCFALRAGGGYAATAVRDGYVTPEAPDANRVFFTGGLGYHAGNHFDVDVSFEYEDLLARTQTNIQTQLSGTFKTNVYIPGISIAYHW